MNSLVKPFFSIVTISFNQEAYVRQCIESVLKQTFKNFEYIIQDPGSTDKSREIINEFKNDSRVKIFFENDSSPAEGLNKGFSKAKGSYFLFLNSDDELCLDALENIFQQIIIHPGYDVYSGAAMVINNNGELLRLTFSDKMNLQRAAYGHCIIVQPSTVFTSKIFKKVGGFNNNNTINWDGELFIDFAIKLAKFKVFKNIISKYRLTNTSITGSGLSLLCKEREKKRIYKKIYKKDPKSFFTLISFFFRLLRKILNIEDTIQRIFHGKIAGRFLENSK